MSKEQPCHCCGGTGKENDHQAIGAHLRSLREKKGIMAVQVAQALDISPQYLCDLELGRRAWTQQLITEYKLALGIGL